MRRAANQRQIQATHLIVSFGAIPFIDNFRERYLRLKRIAAKVTGQPQPYDKRRSMVESFESYRRYLLTSGTRTIITGRRQAGGKILEKRLRSRLGRTGSFDTLLIIERGDSKMVDQIKSNSGHKGTKAEKLTADLGRRC